MLPWIASKLAGKAGPWIAIGLAGALALSVAWGGVQAIGKARAVAKLERTKAAHAEDIAAYSRALADGETKAREALQAAIAEADAKRVEIQRKASTLR